MSAQIEKSLHKRLFDVAAELEEIAHEMDDDHDKRIIEGAAWDVNAMGNVQQEIHEIQNNE